MKNIGKQILCAFVLFWFYARRSYGSVAAGERDQLDGPGVAGDAAVVFGAEHNVAIRHVFYVARNGAEFVEAGQIFDADKLADIVGKQLLKRTGVRFFVEVLPRRGIMHAVVFRLGLTGVVAGIFHKSISFFDWGDVRYFADPCGEGESGQIITVGGGVEAMIAQTVDELPYARRKVETAFGGIRVKKP